MLGHGYVLRAYAITKFILFSRIIEILASIVMSYFLVVNYGIIGAAVTFLTAFIVNVLLQVYKTKKLLKTLTELLPWKDFINLLLISTVPAIFLFVINNLPISIFIQLLYGAFCIFHISFHDT